MARRINSRLRVTGELIAQTPLHFGRGEGDTNSDLALAVNGRGLFYAPGTGVAGALRAWSQFRSEPCANALYGPPQTRGGTEGHASFLLVEDSLVPEGTTVEIRDGVGINRLTGAPADGIKFDRAILPRGTRLPLDLTLELDQDDARSAQSEGLLADLLDALEGEDIAIGAAKTRGLGRVRLENRRVSRQSFTSFDGTLQTLRSLVPGVSAALPDYSLAALTGTVLTPRPRLNLDIHWRPDGPLMVYAEQEGLFVDSLPLMSATDAGICPVLPGSGVKGALRTRAECLLRTLLGSPEQSAFLDQVRLPLVSALFGSDGLRNDQKLGLGALSVDDCYSRTTLTRDEWVTLTQTDEANHGNGKSGNEARMKGKLTASVSAWQPATHVGIDRWTGGAADGLLFSVLEPHGLNWEPLRLRLDLTRLGAQAEAAVALLLFTLRDFARGQIPLGHGANHSMGSLTVNAVTVMGRELPGEWQPLEQLQWEQNRLLDAVPDLRTRLNASWQAFVKGPVS